MSGTPSFDANTISVDQDESRTVLRLRGEIDVNAAPDLLQAVRSASGGDKPVVVDCREATRVDTSAIQILIALKRLLDRTACDVEFTSIPADIADYLTVGGFQSIFGVQTVPAATVENA